MEINEITIDKCSFNLEKEIQNAVALVSIQALLKKQKIETCFEDKFPNYIISDPNRYINSSD
jgi:hypothetical protein